MSKPISLYNNKNFEEESSDDSISGLDNPEQPLFYMFPESSEDEDQNESEEENKEKSHIKKKEKNYYFDINKKSISRKTMLTKLDLLAKYHKNSEAKLMNSKIGWHTIYELFFEKLFFIDKIEKEKGIYINLKEVEIRIRKELGKIGKKQYESKPKDTLFTIFDKVQYNPPVSAWYSHNFLSDNSNRLIAPKEKDSYLCKIINEFSNYESHKEEKDNNIKEQSNAQNILNKRVSKNMPNNINNINNMSFMDNMIKKLANIQSENNDNKNNNLLFSNELGNKKDIIPKGAKKVVNKFLKKYNISNISYVEDEINNIQTNEKAYEVELRNSKLFESKFLDENRYLIDFNYLKNAIQKEKKDTNFEYKKELDTLFNQIEKTIDLIGQNNNTEG